METATQVVYWINTAGLSVPYHRLLAEVVGRTVCDGLAGSGKTDTRSLKNNASLDHTLIHGQIRCPFLGRLSGVRQTYLTRRFPSPGRVLYA